MLRSMEFLMSRMILHPRDPAGLRLVVVEVPEDHPIRRDQRQPS